jgi:hypothetical protein
MPTRIPQLQSLEYTSRVRSPDALNWPARHEGGDRAGADRSAGLAVALNSVFQPEDISLLRRRGNAIHLDGRQDLNTSSGSPNGPVGSTS